MDQTDSDSILIKNKELEICQQKSTKKNVLPAEPV